MDCKKLHERFLTAQQTKCPTPTGLGSIKIQLSLSARA